MSRPIGLVLLAFLCSVIHATSASAQRVEGSVSVGYSASEGITTDNRDLLGQIYDTLAVDSGASFNFSSSLAALGAQHSSAMSTDSASRFSNWGGLGVNIVVGCAGRNAHQERSRRLWWTRSTAAARRNDIR